MTDISSVDSKEKKQAWNITKIVVLSSWAASIIVTTLLIGSTIWLSLYHPESPAIPLLKDWANLTLGFLIGQSSNYMKNVGDIAAK